MVRHVSSPVDYILKGVVCVLQALSVAGALPSITPFFWVSRVGSVRGVGSLTSHT